MLRRHTVATALADAAIGKLLQATRLCFSPVATLSLFLLGSGGRAHGSGCRHLGLLQKSWLFKLSGDGLRRAFSEGALVLVYFVDLLLAALTNLFRFFDAFFRPCLSFALLSLVRESLVMRGCVRWLALLLH